jgi:hypothetical protein
MTTHRAIPNALHRAHRLMVEREQFGASQIRMVAARERVVYEHRRWAMVL